MRGDLDWVVMRCLEKDRTHRYATANGLAVDLQRHLQNEPVVACPPGAGYRFQKMVRRHKAVVAASTAVAAALVAGTVVSTWQAVRATRAEREQTRLHQQADAESKKAKTEATRSAQVARFMTDMLNGVGPEVAQGRDTQLLREILDKTEARLDKDLQGQPQVEADLRHTLGNVYSDLADFPKAVAMHRAALALRRQAVGDEHLDVARSLNALGWTLTRQGKASEALACQREALALRRKLLGNEHRDVASALSGVAWALENEGKFAEAEAHYRQALGVARKVFPDDDPALARHIRSLGWILFLQGKQIEAESLLRESLALRRKALPPDHPTLTEESGTLALVLTRLGKGAEAEPIFREGLASTRKKFGNEHQNTANAIHLLGLAVGQQGRLSEAEALQREALAIQRKVLGNEHSEVANSLNELAGLLERQNRLTEAETAIRECLALRRKIQGESHPFVAYTLSQLGSVLQRQGRHVEAETVLREALAWCDQPGADRGAVPEAQSVLGAALAGQKKFTEAEPLLLSGYEGLKRLANPDDIKDALEALIRCYTDWGKPSQAAAWKQKLAELAPPEKR